MALPYAEDYAIPIYTYYSPEYAEHLDPANIDSAWMLTGGSWFRALESMGTIRMADITFGISGEAFLDRVLGSIANIQGTIQRPVTMTFDDGHTVVFPIGTTGVVLFRSGEPQKIRLIPPVAPAPASAQAPLPAGPAPATGGRRRRFTSNNRLRLSRRKSVSRRQRGKPTRR